MMNNLKNEILFVVPNNDGEAVEIQKLLKDNGWNYLVTGQQWGASWDGLEDDIKNDINSGKYQIIYGIELQGSLVNKSIQLRLGKVWDIINIDHHKYENDDRTNKLSSLEQVAKIINVELTDYQKAVSDNDKGYIDLMLENGYTWDTINEVRLQDRKAQGIKKEQEKDAEKAIENLIWFPELRIVKLSHSKCATVTDRLYSEKTNILILSDDGESNFYGHGETCMKLQEKFGGWAGGQLPKNGFWGGYANQQDIANFIISAVVPDYIYKHCAMVGKLCFSAPSGCKECRYATKEKVNKNFKL